jgi:hypothetical protein
LKEQNIKESSFSKGEYRGEFTYSSFSEFVSEKNIVSYNFNIVTTKWRGVGGRPTHCCGMRGAWGKLNGAYGKWVVLYS